MMFKGLQSMHLKGEYRGINNFNAELCGEIMNQNTTNPDKNLQTASADPTLLNLNRRPL